MPLSQELLEQLQKNCVNSREKFIVLLLRDLEGRRVDLSSLTSADLDRVTSRLQFQTIDSQRGQAKLAQDTLKMLHQYSLERLDGSKSLLVGEDGKSLSQGQILETARELAEKSGLEFNRETFQFNAVRIENPRLVSKTASRDLFYLYGIVSHPVRRQIVELLGDEGPLGFSQIKQRLNFKVGTLYYHFDMLAGLVAQDPQKRYVLTESGKDAYRKLRSAEYVHSSELLAEQSPALQTPVERGLRLVVPTRMIVSLQSRTPLAILGAVALVGLGSFSVFQARLATVLLFLDPSNLDPWLLGLGFILSWLVIFAVSDLLATFLFGRKGEHVTLLLGTAYALFPLLLFVAWWDLSTTYNIQAFGLTILGLSRIVLVILQAWCLALLARLVGGLKGLRLDKAAIISLALAYLSIMIAYLRGF